MRIQPPPPDFEKVFIEGGWRAVERAYGERSNVVNRWLHFLGADRVKALRQDYLNGQAPAA